MFQSHRRRGAHDGFSHAVAAKGTSLQLTRQNDCDSIPRRKDQTISCNQRKIVTEAPIGQAHACSRARNGGWARCRFDITTDDDIVSDRPSELIAYEPLDICTFTSNRVLTAVQRVGASRYYVLGLALGFTDDHVRRISHDLVEHADKLLAIFAVKASRVGEPSAERQLLDACKNIEPSIHQMVIDELGKWQSNLSECL